MALIVVLVGLVFVGSASASVPTLTIQEAKSVISDSLEEDYNVTIAATFRRCRSKTRNFVVCETQVRLGSTWWCGRATVRETWDTYIYDTGNLYRNDYFRCW